MRTTLTAGSPAALTVSAPPRQRRCNTRIRPTTLPDLPTCTTMVPGFPVADTATVGGRLALALAGRHSRRDNGSGILPSAGLGRATNRGAGLRIITEAGSLIPAAADGFIPRLCFTDIRRPRSDRSGVFLRVFILRARSIVRS